MTENSRHEIHHPEVRVKYIYPHKQFYIYVYTQRLQCSSFLVMAYFLLRDYNILPKKELLWSLWVCTSTCIYIIIKMCLQMYIYMCTTDFIGYPTTPSILPLEGSPLNSAYSGLIEAN